MFSTIRKAANSITPAGRAQEHAALVAEQAEDERAFLAARAASPERTHDDRIANLRAQLDAAFAAKLACQQGWNETRHAFDVRREARERRLIELADPRIDAFLDQLTKKHDALRHQVRAFEVRGPVSP